MSRIVKVRNATMTGMTVAGHSISAGEYYMLSPSDITNWPNDSDVFALIGSGDLIVCSGSDMMDDIKDPVKGWQWILGDTLPFSTSIEGKLAVHSSTKPEPAGTSTFAVWTGSGDDMTAVAAEDSIGCGELLMFNMTYKPEGKHVLYKDVEFDPRHGRVWIHEAYLKFENGGIPDYLTAMVMGKATQLQQAANLDLVLANNWITYSAGGPGTGTHGFAANPVLVPRPYSKDGDWDFDGTNLTPNFTGSGAYKISDIERKVNQYFNKIPLNGSSATYFTMSSEETAELLVANGYFIRIEVHNESNTPWDVSVIMEIYRERTVSP